MELGEFRCRLTTAGSRASPIIFPTMQSVIGFYREFAPCEALTDYVRAFFSFVPATEETPPQRQITYEVRLGTADLFCPSMLADGHASIVFRLGLTSLESGGWRIDPAGCHGQLIGAVSKADLASVERSAMIGVYFRGARLPFFISTPADEFTDRMVALDDVWGPAASQLPAQLAVMQESERVDALEFALLRRIGTPKEACSINMPRLTQAVVQRRGRVSVDGLATEAGVSRQHLARLFRTHVGVSPKLYCRLARFQSGLAFATRGETVEWAQAALDLGYADQSHMIGEFREFSGLTPEVLAAKPWFHPFIARARAKQIRSQQSGSY